MWKQSLIIQLFLLLTAPVARAESTVIDKILLTHCSECHHTGHSPDLVKGAWQLGTAGKQQVVDAVSAGKMPPSPRDQLTADELAALKAWAQSN